jgi:hypothetical protein
MLCYKLGVSNAKASTLYRKEDRRYGRINTLCSCTSFPRGIHSPCFRVCAEARNLGAGTTQ